MRGSPPRPAGPDGKSSTHRARPCFKMQMCTRRAAAPRLPSCLWGGQCFTPASPPPSSHPCSPRRPSTSHTSCRCRRQPLCTVSNRTHYFSPPTRNSPGPWPTPRSPHPHAPLAGLAVCLSPQASSSHPGSASTPAGSHSALANGWMTQGGHGGLGGGFDPWLPCTLHTFQNS